MLTCSKGCNIPDIPLVVQWKVPDKLSSAVQRFGRAGRRPDIDALAVLIAEPSAYSVDSSTLPSAVGGKRGKSRKGPKVPKAPQGLKSACGTGKKKSAPAETTHADITAANEGVNDIPMPPAHRNLDNSRHRPLTPIGEDDKALAASPAQQRSPQSINTKSKLVRKGAPVMDRSASDSWPLPEPPKVGPDQRPQSSDGIVNRRASLRPVLSKRFSSGTAGTVQTDVGVGGREVAVGRSGKKKRFQGLRRAFGLYD